MSRATRAAIVVLVGIVLVPAATVGPGTPVVRAQAPPYRTGSREPLEFRGPGRESPDPDVSEVVLGWFGPGDPDHPDFGTLWRGAILALDEENTAGGYRGRTPAGNGTPFRLEPVWSESPWQAGIADLVRLVYERGAWAVIGGVDGTSTHLAVQVALKSQFLLLSPGSTDVTADRANVPWLFSLPPSDDAVAPVIVNAVAADARDGQFSILASTDHATHATLVSTRRELDRRRLTPVSLVEVAVSDDVELAAAVAHVLEDRPRSLLVLAPARKAGRIVARLRASGFTGAIVAGLSAASAAFSAAAGLAAEGVFVPVPRGHGPGWDDFVAAYRNRWRSAPDMPAACGFDAVKLTIAAVRHAGLNRARIRDAVRALAPWSGAGGTVRWDAVGRNQPGVVLGRWTGGRLLEDPR